MTSTSLKDLRFPVYRLPSEPSEENGVRFFETLSHLTGDTSITVVDDLKIKKPTLGLRRLALRKKNIKLFNFKTAVYTIGDMVRLNTESSTMWLDSEGKLFKLPKSTMYKIEFRKITNIYQKVGYVILVLEGEVQRFRSVYGPPSSHYGALILVNGHTRLFYGYALPEAKVRRRKV